MAALAMQEDNWTPAKLIEHRAWRAKMYAPEKPVPKPDPLAARLEVAADPDKLALECKVRELEDKLQFLRDEMLRTKHLRAASVEALECEPVIRLEQIITTVARYYGLTVKELKSARRTQSVVIPRHVAAYLCATLTLRSLPEIGRHIGGRDHTTIINARDRISTRRLTDAALCQEVAELEALFV